MQIAIEIPDKVYEMVMNTGAYGCYRFNSAKAIREGVPLDKIRDEIIEMRSKKNCSCSDCIDIIDKYKAESEEE